MLSLCASRHEWESGEDPCHQLPKSGTPTASACLSHSACSTNPQMLGMSFLVGGSRRTTHASDSGLGGVADSLSTVMPLFHLSDNKPRAGFTGGCMQPYQAQELCLPCCAGPSNGPLSRQLRPYQPLSLGNQSPWAQDPGLGWAGESSSHCCFSLRCAGSPTFRSGSVSHAASSGGSMEAARLSPTARMAPMRVSTVGGKDEGSQRLQLPAPCRSELLRLQKLRSQREGLPLSCTVVSCLKQLLRLHSAGKHSPQHASVDAGP